MYFGDRIRRFSHRKGPPKLDTLQLKSQIWKSPKLQTTEIWPKRHRITSEKCRTTEVYPKLPLDNCWEILALIIWKRIRYTILYQNLSMRQWFVFIWHFNYHIASQSTKIRQTYPNVLFVCLSIVCVCSDTVSTLLRHSFDTVSTMFKPKGSNPWVAKSCNLKCR